MGFCIMDLGVSSLYMWFCLTATTTSVSSRKCENLMKQSDRL
jgi:hypothetical protein